MEIGIITRTFERPTLAAVLDAVAAHGLHAVQLTLSSAGWADLPDAIPPGLADSVREAVESRGLRVAAVTGTYNMIHPDLQRRRDGLRRLGVLVSACARLGTRTVTLCTGTRDPDYMWRRHPDNDLPDAWRNLVVVVREAVRMAEDSGVILAIEPEVSNVIDSAAKARRLLDAVPSGCLKICMDGANIFHAGELPRMRAILDEAFALLGDHLILAHAKDLNRDGEAGQEAAGTGLLDYNHYLSLLRASGYDGPLILHSLREEQVPGCVAFLRRKLGE